MSKTINITGQFSMAVFDQFSMAVYNADPLSDCITGRVMESFLSFSIAFYASKLFGSKSIEAIRA